MGVWPMSLLMRRIALIFSLAAIAGCATGKRNIVTPAVATTAPATRPFDKGDLALEEIEPRPVLGSGAASSSQPSTAVDDDPKKSRPPLDAIVLFAQAREAMLNNQRNTAINLLERAVNLDPGSYELLYMLGQAYTAGGLANEKSIAAYEKAAEIQPDHIVVHSELGRQYLAKDDLPRAIEHLRLATQTREYQDDDSAAAVVNFYLAKALQRAGYDRAALECYDKLIDRLQAGGLSTRSSPELAYLASQPEGLFVQVGELMEKRGRRDDAIELYQLAVAHKPDDFGFQAHLVRALSGAGRRDEATKTATDAVRRFRASRDSLELLREIFRQTGGDEAVARELSRVRRERPNDRTVLYALVDVLSTSGKPERATQILADAARETRYETDLVRRLFKLYDSAGDCESAAKLLVEGLAARPDNTRDLAPLWQPILRPWRKNHITVTRLQALEVSPQAQAAKLFWVAELARVWNREPLVRSSLEQSVAQVPPFAPSYRVLLQQYWTRDDWDVSRKREASQKLISSVERQGDAILAAELRGVVLLNDRDPARACDQFAKAQALGGDATDLRLAYAAALRARGDSDAAEKVYWKLATDQPTCEDAYLNLFHGYLQKKQIDPAMNVLKTWLANDPMSINAYILESVVFLQLNQAEAAERTLNELFDREPDSSDVLTALANFFNQTGRTDDFIKKLEAQQTEHPDNRLAVEQLVMIYAQQKRLPDATRVLDAARTSAGNDVDSLYYIGGLYTRIGQKETTEQVLQQIVGIDPHHAPASNDLGYGWAEQGKNLVRAEALVRVAVQIEPDNSSFLDSLGWVLYKRGRFDQARQQLELAVSDASFPDPVVLDHLGDTLYRLDKKSDAATQWKRAADRIPKDLADDSRDDLKQLRLQLQQKLKQSEAGQPVSVSPVADEPPKQAKN